MIDVLITETNGSGIQTSTWEQIVNLTMDEIIEFIRRKEGKDEPTVRKGFPAWNSSPPLWPSTWKSR